MIRLQRADSACRFFTDISAMPPRLAQTAIAIGLGVALSCTRPHGDRSYDGIAIACRPLLENPAPQRVVLAELGSAPSSPLARAFLAAATR